MTPHEALDALERAARVHERAARVHERGLITTDEYAHELAQIRYAHELAQIVRYALPADVVRPEWIYGPKDAGDGS